MAESVLPIWPSRTPSLEPLSDSEIRVLRYLPTNLSGPEIARELCVSLNTVRTHMRNLYAKLGTHREPTPSRSPVPSACWRPPRPRAGPCFLADGWTLWTTSPGCIWLRAPERTPQSASRLH
jgi:DNA-binding CsgD family transcriptional regulator